MANKKFSEFTKVTATGQSRQNTFFAGYDPTKTIGSQNIRMDANDGGNIVYPVIQGKQYSADATSVKTLVDSLQTDTVLVDGQTFSLNNGRDYKYDASDTTTAGNDNTVIVSAGGRRLKIIPKNFEFANVNDAVTNEAKLLPNDSIVILGAQGGTFRVANSGTANGGIIFDLGLKKLIRDIGQASFIHAKWFGAVGDYNGTTGTDDTAALQAALDYIVTIGGGTLYLSKGRYLITDSLIVTAVVSIRIIGDGLAVRNDFNTGSVISARMTDGQKPAMKFAAQVENPPSMASRNFPLDVSQQLQTGTLDVSYRYKPDLPIAGQWANPFPGPKVSLENFGLEGGCYPLAGLVNQNADGIYMAGCYRSRIHNIHIQGFMGAALYARHNYGSAMYSSSLTSSGVGIMSYNGWIQTYNCYVHYNHVGGINQYFDQNTVWEANNHFGLLYENNSSGAQILLRGSYTEGNNFQNEIDGAAEIRISGNTVKTLVLDSCYSSSQQPRTHYFKGFVDTLKMSGNMRMFPPQIGYANFNFEGSVTAKYSDIKNYVVEVASGQQINFTESEKSPIITVTGSTLNLNLTQLGYIEITAPTKFEIANIIVSPAIRGKRLLVKIADTSPVGNIVFFTGVGNLRFPGGTARYTPPPGTILEFQTDTSVGFTWQLVSTSVPRSDKIKSVSADYTLIPLDINYDETVQLHCINSTNITVTLPNNTTATIELGRKIRIQKRDAGNVTIVSESGATLRNGTKNKISTTFDVIEVQKTGTNEWTVVSANLSNKTGTGSPIGLVTPDFMGHKYYDTTVGSPAIWEAYGLTNNDWLQISTPI